MIFLHLEEPNKVWCCTFSCSSGVLNHGDNLRRNKEAWSKTSIRWGGVKTFVNKRWMVCRTVMIRCALESPYLGQPFKYLERYHITHRKIFRATWSQKVRQKQMKTQKFWESQLALKNKILSFARFLRISSTSTLPNVLIWCALDSPALEQLFKYFERQHITHRKIFRAS